MSGRAFTRAVSPRLADCALTHLERLPIDAARAAAQHRAYEQALREAGLEVIRLPELPDHPDAVFVEDTAILLGDHAVITRPGIASRAGETASTAAGLAGHFRVAELPGGNLDGGDVLRIENTLYVGRSSRTDRDGIAALRNLVRPLGFAVVEADMGACLHLKTGATFAGPDGSGTPVLLYDPQCIDPYQFGRVEPMAVAQGEAAAANCLRVDGRLIIAAGTPRTADRLRERGFDVVEVETTEFQKAEAGVTCMSLVSPPNWLGLSPLRFAPGAPIQDRPPDGHELERVKGIEPSS